VRGIKGVILGFGAFEKVKLSTLAPCRVTVARQPKGLEGCFAGRNIELSAERAKHLDDD
jgi:hypothetical protein